MLLSLVFFLSACGSPANPSAIGNYQPAAVKTPAESNAPAAIKPSEATSTPKATTTPAINNPSVVNNPPAAPVEKTKPETAKRAAVTIQNYAFNPQAQIVSKGTTVTWTNNDSAPHQIKSTTFNSGLLAQGQSYSYTFASAGSYDYICSVHPSMTGTIIVQ